MASATIGVSRSGSLRANHQTWVSSTSIQFPDPLDRPDNVARRPPESREAAQNRPRWAIFERKQARHWLSPFGDHNGLFVVSHAVQELETVRF